MNHRLTNDFIQDLADILGCSTHIMFHSNDQWLGMLISCHDANQYIAIMEKVKSIDPIIFTALLKKHKIYIDKDDYFQLSVSIAKTTIVDFYKDHTSIL